MIATLQMYDLPEVQAATDSFWAAISRRAGLDVVLSRPADHVSPWRQPDLLFSQTCGYPFTHEFAGRLKLVATPHYKADGCEGPLYRSIVFARTPRPLPGFRGSRAVFNNRDSMSGMLALKLVFAPLAEKGKFFAQAVETGSHVASLAALQQGGADVAAIDCVTVALLRRYRPQALEGLVEVARSPLVPGLPFVTRGGASEMEVARLRAALEGIFADEKLHTIRDTLKLKGFSVLSSEDYAVIPRLESALEEQGSLTLW
jgi:ABC-type phosphate/phosphonate transport system substrate-binding protein